MILSFFKKNHKRIIILIFLIVILIFIAFKFLSTYSVSYNNWLAKKEFNKMCNMIETTEIDDIELYIGNNCGKIDIHQINNIDKLSDSLIYSGIAPEESISTDKNLFIGFEINFSNNRFISLGTTNSTDFKVHYGNKNFYVNSQILTEFIGSDIFNQIKNDWNSFS